MYTTLGTPHSTPTAAEDASGAALGDRNRSLLNRWVVLALLTVAAAINYIDRSCMAVAAPKIQQEFALSNTEIGFILGVFQWGYVAAYLAAGLLVDRLGSGRGYALLMAVWSVADACTALAGSFRGLVGLRFLLGVGEAGCWPASNKVVAETFPAAERPLACGVFDSGAKLGMIAGPPLVAFIILNWGWRPPFVVTGLLGFLWIPAWLWIHRRRSATAARPARPFPSAIGVGPRAPGSWFDLLRYPEVWGVLLLNASTATTWFVLSNWLTKYFYDVRHVNYDVLGWYLALPMVGAVVGNVGGGILLGSLLNRANFELKRARRLMIFISVGMMFCMIPAVHVPSTAWCIVLMMIAGAGYSSHATNILSLISDLVSKDRVATLTGIQATGAFLATLPLVTYAGWIVDRFGYPALFQICALLPCLSIVVAFTLIRRFAPLRLGATATGTSAG
jgi:ACS family hexuronate transporter-like MFS transporter